MDAEPRAHHQLSAGLPDGAFVTDGLLTKRALRAYALAMLEPRGDQRLWDLGAGTGSIGSEWCRLHPGNTVVAVERRAERTERIESNARVHGVSGQVQVVVGDLAEVLPALPAPDAVFVGGGVTYELIERCWGLLPSAGRLVAHSVTADSDTVLLRAYQQWGGELARIGVEQAEPIG
ncbi:MAG: precorrin-6Y C5,15-methyltransferase (decarboxylating) subunit CbiT, partial [Arachnia sp.]